MREFGHSWADAKKGHLVLSNGAGDVMYFLEGRGEPEWPSHHKVAILPPSVTQASLRMFERT